MTCLCGLESEKNSKRYFKSCLLSKERNYFNVLLQLVTIFITACWRTLNFESMIEWQKFEKVGDYIHS